MRKAYYIFKKDLLQEFKTRYALNAIMLFAVVTLTAVSYSVGTYSAGPEMLSALLWIILFFSSMSGMAHIFVREEESRTADTLKLLSVPGSVFMGKLFFNIVLLFSLELIVVPLFLAVMSFTLKNYLLFVLILFTGSFGLAGGGTMVAAIISKSSAKGALFTVLSFPILLPVLVAGISATKKAAMVGTMASASAEIQSLIAFSVVIITASFLLFDFVWNE